MKLLRRAEPIDQDIMLITDYLSRALAPSEMRAVEERLATDYAFYMKVGPVIKVWRMPARCFAVQPARAGAARKSGWSRRLPRLLWSAAALFLVVTLTRGYLDYKERKQIHDDLVMQRAPSVWVQNAEKVETLPGETKIAETPRETRVTVRGDSRFLYQAFMKVVPNGGFMWATLDGEAALDVTAAEGIVQLKTWAGRVDMEKGSYAVRCAPGCSAMLVTVGAGLATLVADSTRPGLVLHSGEKGRLPKNGEPEKITTGGDDWPAIATAAEKAMPAIHGGDQQPAQSKAKP